MIVTLHLLISFSCFIIDTLFEYQYNCVDNIFLKNRVCEGKMKTLKPFLRYISLNNKFANNFYTKSRDCRFLYVLKGTYTFHTENANFKLFPNSLLYYPCGISYYLEATMGDSHYDSEYITINFDFSHNYSHIKDCLFPIKAELFKAEFLLPSNQNIDMPIFSTPFVVDDIPHVKEDLLRLTKMFHKVNPYTEDICSSILSTIIYSILYTTEQRNTSNTIAESIKKYIDSHYSENITNSTLAKHFNYHPYYINTVFKQLTGETLHKYLMRYRINRSQELLLSTDMSIQQIAVACGFGNQAHFSTYFKKLNHTTPQEFRKKYDLI